MPLSVAVWKSKFDGVCARHRRDACSMAWRCRFLAADRARAVASSPRNDLVKYCRVHPTDWLISTQVSGRCAKALVDRPQVAY